MDSNTTLIVNEIRNLSGRISDLPTKSDVKVAVMEGIQEHEDRCQGAKLSVVVAENTTKIKLMERVRNSITPSAPKDWRGVVKILVPLAMAAAGAWFGFGPMVTP